MPDKDGKGELRDYTATNPVVAWSASHDLTPRPLEDYAQDLATTPHLLLKAVRAAFAKTPYQLVIERQVVEAKRLLLFTIRPVADIAYELGFRDPAYFSRFFRRHCGKPPGAWRTQETDRRGR